MPYVFDGVGPTAVHSTLRYMVAALNELLDATCDYHRDYPAESEAKAAALKMSLVRALCIVERDLPESELSIFLHEVVHLADFLYRWNNVRNYWCFITERFVGYMKGFVKNRHLVLESMVRSYCRGILVRSIPPNITDHANGAFSYKSLLEAQAPVIALLPYQKGFGGIHFSLHSHNHFSINEREVMGLRAAVNEYFRNHVFYNHVVRLCPTVDVISTLIWVNGTKWKVGSVCEYAAFGANSHMRLKVGVICAFIVVRFTEHRGSSNTKQELFVRFRYFDEAGVTRIHMCDRTGSNNMYMYRVRKSSRNRGAIDIVHADALYSLMCSVPDSQGGEGYVNLSLVAKAFAD